MASDKKSTFAVLLAGMLIGGFVVFLLFLSKLELPSTPQTSDSQSPTKGETSQPSPNTAEVDGPEEENKFDFYQMLPEIEVTIDGDKASSTPKTEKPVAVKPTNINAPFYYLQVGAFSEYQSANKHKANLLLNNFPTKVQKGSNSAGKTLFRVYVGPYSEGKPLDTAVNQLKELGLNPYKQRL